MKARLTAAALLCLAGCALPGAAPAGAQAAGPHVDVGIGDQSPNLFDDPRFRSTGIRFARLIVPFDLVRAGGRQLEEADAWLERARDEGVEPLVSFAHSGRTGGRLKLPSVDDYGRRVREFRRRYPWVRELSTWNEANLAGVQPTARNPWRTAAFYRELRRQCRRAGCRVLAVEVLLTGSWKTWRWIRQFRAAAGRGPHTWGIHNYPDVTRLRRRNTGIFLRRVPRDRVWFTETGGIVRFARSWRHDERRAARAVAHTFRLAASSRRVRRLYLYNWRAGPAGLRWDSGFFSAEGIERRAYAELLDALSLERFRPPAPPVTTDPPARGPVDLGPDEDD